MSQKIRKEIAISVIIPAHNEKKTISSCILSIKNQTYRPHEIIIVDDGSTDDTGAIARGLGVKVITLKKTFNRGIARNKGAANASGEYVAFLDSDSLADKDWLKYLARALQMHDIVSDRRSVWQPDTFYLKCLQANYDILYNFQYHPRCGWAMKRSLFDAIGGFDKSISAGEEHDLGRRILNTGITIGFEAHAIQYHNGPPRMFFDGLRRRFDHAKRRISFVRKYTDALPVRQIFFTMIFFLFAALSVLSVYHFMIFLLYLTFWYASILVHQGISRRGFFVAPVSLVLGLSAIRITEQIVESLGTVSGRFTTQSVHPSTKIV